MLETKQIVDPCEGSGGPCMILLMIELVLGWGCGSIYAVRSFLSTVSCPCNHACMREEEERLEEQ